MNKVLVSALLAAVASSGCAERSPVQTVDWYRQHDTERTAMIAKCDSDPGELAASPNCVNAKRAANMKDNARRGYVVPKPVDFNAKEG